MFTVKFVGSCLCLAQITAPAWLLSVQISALSYFKGGGLYAYFTLTLEHIFGRG